MREQLIQYVNLLFAGAPDACDIKEEILQNTLDRYDDLVSQGKTPEAAYSLAISGIGDLSEILRSRPVNAPVYAEAAKTTQLSQPDSDPLYKKILRIVAIFLYIICMIPLIILSEMGMDTIGLCGTLSIVAVATVALLTGKKSGSQTSQKNTEETVSARQELRKSVHSIVWAIGLAAYFIVSFLTNAWYITWVIFPLIGCVNGLINACIDLKEASNYEN